MDQRTESPEAAKEVEALKAPILPSIFRPRTMDEMVQLSEHLAKSGIVPVSLKGKPHDIFVAIGMGMELGLSPFQAVQNIAVINGKPSLYGDAAKALVNVNEDLESFEELDAHKALEKGYGYCKIKRKSQPVPYECTFTVEDAKRAQLWTKAGPWQLYPGRMLQMRARGFAIRDAFAESLKGLILREEAQDMPTKPEIQMPREIGEVPPEAVEDENRIITQDERKKLFAIWKGAGLKEPDLRKHLEAKYGNSSTAKLTVGQLNEIARELEGSKR